MGAFPGLLTRREQLLGALERAGRRGLTRDEMRQLVGENWRRRIADLERDGHVFRVEPSRVTGRPWRWVHIIAPTPPPAEVSAIDDGRLFDPPAPPATSALLELDAVR